MLSLYWILDIGTWTIARQPLRSLIFNISGLSFALMLPWFGAMRPLGPLGSALIGWVSLRSYSLYLVHLPILDLVFRLGDRPKGLRIAPGRRPWSGCLSSQRSSIAPWSAR